MPQINYNNNTDDLEIVFQQIDIPEVVKLDTGVVLEFGEEQLSAIILPNFFQMLHRPPDPNLQFKFIGFEDDTLKIQVDEQKINIKIDLSILENS